MLRDLLGFYEPWSSLSYEHNCYEDHFTEQLDKFFTSIGIDATSPAGTALGLTGLLRVAEGIDSVWRFVLTGVATTGAERAGSLICGMHAQPIIQLFLHVLTCFCDFTGVLEFGGLIYTLFLAIFLLFGLAVVRVSVATVALLADIIVAATARRTDKEEEENKKKAEEKKEKKKEEKKGGEKGEKKDEPKAITPGAKAAAEWQKNTKATKTKGAGSSSAPKPRVFSSAGRRTSVSVVRGIFGRAKQALLPVSYHDVSPESDGNESV